MQFSETVSQVNGALLIDLASMLISRCGICDYISKLLKTTTTLIKKVVTFRLACHRMNPLTA
jgi:hypothetical protein